MGLTVKIVSTKKLTVRRKRKWQSGAKENDSQEQKKLKTRSKRIWQTGAKEIESQEDKKLTVRS